MAKFNNIHLLRGKVGDKVYCRRRDFGSYVRALGTYKDEPSNAQLACRVKLKMAVEFLNPLRRLLDECWMDSSVRKRGFNGASGYFIKNTFTGEYPELQVKYEEVCFSNGRLAVPDEAEMIIDTNSVFVSWKNLQRFQAGPDDEAIIILYNEDYKALCLFRNSAIRQQEHAILKVTEEFIRGTLHGYLFFISYTGKQVSRTVYLGCLRIEGTNGSV